MRGVLQRVSRAAVSVGGRQVARIGQGLVVLVGVGRADTAETLQPFVDKVAHLRVFEGQTGHFDRSLLDTGLELLLVSQFTLYGDVRRGRRPDFSAAANGGEAGPLFAALVPRFRDLGVPTQTGEFGASMAVELVNDGPVTIIVDV